MAARARQIDTSTQAAPARARPKPRAASGEDQAAPSPALMLQQALAAEILPAEPERKWPAAATLGFIVMTCGAFWATVAVALTRVF